MIFGIMASILGIYSIILLIRIVLSWFGNMAQGRFVSFLELLTDPYLNWWRRNLNLRIGVIDFSAIAGIAALSIAQNVLFLISRFDTITIGSILSIVTLTVWSVISFILGFFIIVIILRLIAYLTNRDSYTMFWQFVESVSQPILYRIGRIVNGNKISHYLSEIIISLIILIALWIGGKIAIPYLAVFLAGLPI